MNDVTTWCINFRNTRELSQRELAKMIDVSGAYVAQVETGKFVRPMNYIKKLLPMSTKEEKQEIRDILALMAMEDLG